MSYGDEKGFPMFVLGGVGGYAWGREGLLICLRIKVVFACLYAQFLGWEP